MSSDESNATATVASPVTLRAIDGAKSQSSAGFRAEQSTALVQRFVHVLPSLPYAKDALAPCISARTLNFHHGRHHLAYVDALNALLDARTQDNSKADARAYLGMSLPQLIAATAGDSAQAGIYHNAAQCFSHSFYWNSLRPVSAAEPPLAVRALIDTSFGSLANCKAALTKCAMAHFGSGWVWLVLVNGRLEVLSTHDADVPMTLGKQPLWCMDVWEHAYYLDYQNRRAEYVAALLDDLINWDFVAANLLLQPAAGAAPPARG